MEPALIDTSAIFALLDSDDANHARARHALRLLAAGRHPLVLTNFILAESHALIVTRLSHDLARRWLGAVAWPVERATSPDESRATTIVLRYRDKSFSYTDAVSFAVMERLGLRHAFTFDRHFAQYGFELVDALR